MDKNYLKYTCLFGGGAIRGISYVGAVKALEELEINPTTLAGSSVGSIIAALLAVGYDSKELKEIFLKVNFELFRDIQLGIGPKFAISKGEVFLEWLRDLIEQKYYGDKYKKGCMRAVTFKDIEKNLVVITTDLSNFECKEFSRFETPDYEIAKAVRISSSMPGLMKPIEYNNTLLVDGDLQKSWPMWKLSKNLVIDGERILEFRLEGLIEDNDMNALDFANAVYSCMTALATEFVTDIYAKRDKFDYIVLNTGDIIVVDFNIPTDKRECLIKSGYDQTMNYFKSLLPAKKSVILNYYKKIFTHLQTIQKYIESSKIIKAKIRIGELFIDLCEIGKIIDCSFYKDIKAFKDMFFDNINYP
ncbi:MAG: patatin-like phospholipase family protein, partial [Candidatus Gastranaerophilaceae bacterium]